MNKPKKINSKLSGWLSKEEATKINVDVNNITLYHGTSNKKSKEIDKNGLCSVIDKTYNISEGIYLTSDKEQAYKWALRSKNKDKSEYGTIYSINGKDIKNLGCNIHPDWNMGFAGKLDNIVLLNCMCIPKTKLKIIKENIW